MSMKPHTEGYVLEENEYLLKIRDYYKDVATGFLTKYNKNGSIPVSFNKWGDWNKVSLPIYIFTETYRSGWKFLGARFGESQNWAILLHPEGFTLEIYMTSFIDLCQHNTIINGEIQGEFYWHKNTLVRK